MHELQGLQRRSSAPEPWAHRPIPAPSPEEEQLLHRQPQLGLVLNDNV